MITLLLVARQTSIRFLVTLWGTHLCHLNKPHDHIIQVSNSLVLQLKFRLFPSRQCNTILSYLLRFRWANVNNISYHIYLNRHLKTIFPITDCVKSWKMMATKKKFTVNKRTLGTTSFSPTQLPASVLSYLNQATSISVKIRLIIKNERVWGSHWRNQWPRSFPKKASLRCPKSTLLLFASLLVERTLSAPRPWPLVLSPFSRKSEPVWDSRVARLLFAERNFPRRFIGAKQLQDPDSRGIFSEWGTVLELLKAMDSPTIWRMSFEGRRQQDQYSRLQAWVGFWQVRVHQHRADGKPVGVRKPWLCAPVVHFRGSWINPSKLKKLLFIRNMYWCVKSIMLPTSGNLCAIGKIMSTNGHLAVN